MTLTNATAAASFAAAVLAAPAGLLMDTRRHPGRDSGQVSAAVVNGGSRYRAEELELGGRVLGAFRRENGR